jgi:hypothetical protein
MKWGIDDCAVDRFDEVIPAGMILDFEIPIDPISNARYTAANFLERAASAAIVVIEK